MRLAAAGLIRLSGPCPGGDPAMETEIDRQLEDTSPCPVGHATVNWLMPPAYVKPYVKRQKNDATDAEAICEAVTRTNMRFVPTKTAEQQSGLVLHRARHLFIRQQTSVINAIRAHLAEFGIVAPVGRHGVEELLNVVTDPNDKRVPDIARACLSASASLYDQVWMTGWRFTSSMPAIMRSLSSCFEVTRMWRRTDRSGWTLSWPLSAPIWTSSNVSVRSVIPSGQHRAGGVSARRLSDAAGLRCCRYQLSAATDQHCRLGGRRVRASPMRC